MRRVLVVMAAAAAGMFSLASEAVAWGDHGHKVVCEIAVRLAEPSTRTPSAIGQSSADRVFGKDSEMIDRE